MDKTKSRPAGRAVSRNSMLFAPLSERLLGAPELRGLSLDEFGFYCILLARSDVYGAIEIYSNIAATMGTILHGFMDAVSPRKFRDMVTALLEHDLLFFLTFNDRDAMILPHKLPSQKLQYYAQPRVIPAGMIVAHILSQAGFRGGYLAELVQDFNFNICLQEGELVDMGFTMVPAWLEPRNRRRTSKPVEKAVADLQQEIELEHPALVAKPVEPLPPPPKVLDLRVVALQNYINDNGFDVVVTDQKMLEFVINYGADYVQEMIKEYGIWRLNNPTKAKKHSKHHLAMDKAWVHQNVQILMLPNPDDKYKRLAPNVVVSPVDEAELLKRIQDQLKCKPENARLYLNEFVSKVSGMKRRMMITSITEDANFVLTYLERQVQYGQHGQQKK